MSYYTRIRDLREDRDLTQKQLADVLFMHLTQYRRYETGEREITLELAIALSNFYNVSLDYLAGVSDKIHTVPENSLTLNETLLLRNFRKLKESDQKKALAIITILQT